MSLPKLDLGISDIQHDVTRDIVGQILPAVESAVRGGIADVGRQVTADVVEKIIPAVSAALAEGIGGALQQLPVVIRQSVEGLTITVSFGYRK